MDRLERLLVPEIKELKITLMSATSSRRWEEFVNAKKQLHFIPLFLVIY